MLSLIYTVTYIFELKFWYQGYAQGNKTQKNLNTRKKYEYQDFQNLCLKVSISWRH